MTRLVYERAIQLEGLQGFLLGFLLDLSKVSKLVLMALVSVTVSVSLPDQLSGLMTVNW